MGPCELTAAYPEDQGYPFSRTRFEASPLARPVEQGGPGKDLAINPIVPEAERHTTCTSYGLNVRDGVFDDLPSGQYAQTTVRNPDGVPVATVADRLGRVVAGRQGPVKTGALTRLFYDAYGNVTRAFQPNAFDPDVPDRDRFAEQMSYDFFGNVIQSQGPDATAPEQSVYDRAGHLRFFQSADGAAHGYVNYLCYDALGRVAEEGTCNCAWDRTAFQAHANERDWLPAAGLWSRRYVYDGTGQDLRLLGRLWKAQTGRGDGSSAVLAEITLAYDAAGRLASRTTSVFAYDGGAPHRTTFGYDSAGNTTRVTYDAERGEAAFSIIYARNGLNEVVGVAARDGEDGLPQPVAAYSYRPDGGVSVETYSPGRSGELRRTYTYSPAGWLAAVRDPYVSETLEYTAGGYHDAGYYTGQVARAAVLFSGVDQPGFVSSYEYAYAYDPLGRLAVAQNSAGSNWSLGVNRPLSHDANGNTVDFQVGADQEKFTYYPGTNRLQNTDGSAARAYAYDESGNLTADGPAGLAGITYDRVSGLVTRVNRAAGGAVTPMELAYDAVGNRVLKTWESMRRLYVPNADGVPLLLKTAEGEAETTDFLIYGPAGLIGVRRGGRTYHVLRGRLGSTRGIFDGVGLIAAYNYMPYGGFMGPVFEKAGAPSMPYLFTGQEYDREVGLYNFKARLYDPATGRFIRTDPAGQYPSPYLYAGNDPVNFYDPTGAFSWSWAAFGAVVGGVLLIAGGIALTIATAGAATPALVAGAIGGGLLIGAGVGSAAYGFSHADASKSNFDPVEWGIMVGLGAGFGALGAGLGFAAAGLGALGRGPMLRTNRLVQQSRGLGPDATGTMFVATQNTTRTIWHSVVGTRLPLKPARFTELVAEFDHISVGAILRGGQETDIIASGGLQTVRNWTAHGGTMRTVGMSSVDLPIPNVRNASTFARDALGPHGDFNFLTNGCTSWAREVLRASGIEPPLWTLSATGLEFWVRTLGRRVV